MTENHFYCILYLYVFQVGTPDYKFGAFDRASLRNLYPKPSSHVLSKISFLKSITNTTCYLPTYWFPPLQRRINLCPRVFPTKECCKPRRYRPLQRHVMWTSLVAEYQFLALLPKANYATMVVSTARHIPEVEPPGMEGILSSPYLK